MFSDEQIENIKYVKRELKEIIVNNTSNGINPSAWQREVDFNRFFISGGVTASLLQRKKPKDVDLYCFDKDYVLMIKELLLAKYSDKIMDWGEEYGSTGTIPAITTNAITMNNSLSFIFTWAGTPDEVRSNFDYVHCMPWYDIKNDTLHISEKQYYACTHKKLIVNNPQSVTPTRKDKFLKRDYVYEQLSTTTRN